MRLAAIHRYPVKSLRGHAMDEAAVEAIGLAGDRRWMVVDAVGAFQTIRQIPAMTGIDVDPRADGLVLRHAEHGMVAVAVPPAGTPVESVRIWRDTVEAVAADPAAGRFLSAALDRPVRLVYLADPRARAVDPGYGDAGDRVSFADGFPLLLTTAGSLDDLNGRLAAPVSMRRFRPNLVLEGASPWAEDGWRTIRVGRVRFRVAKPCGRCVVTTRDPDTGAQPDGNEPLRTLGRFHRDARGEIIFGQNLIPLDQGPIAVGDPVEVLEAGPSNLL